MAFFDSKKTLLNKLAEDTKIATALKDLFMSGQIQPDINFEEVLKNLEKVIKRTKKGENALDKISDRDKPLMKLLLTIRGKNDKEPLALFGVTDKNIRQLLSQELKGAAKEYRQSKTEAQTVEYKHLSQTFQIDAAKHLGERLAIENKTYTASELNGLRREIIDSKNKSSDNMKTLQERVKQERIKYNDKSLKDYDVKALEEAEYDLRLAQRGGHGLDSDKQKLGELYRKFTMERRPDPTMITSQDGTQQPAFPHDYNTENFELNQWTEFSNYILHLQQNPQKLTGLFAKRNDDQIRIQKYHDQKKAAMEARHEKLLGNLQDAIERSNPMPDVKAAAQQLSTEQILAGLSRTNPKAANTIAREMGLPKIPVTKPAAVKPATTAAASAEPASASTPAASAAVSSKTAELEAQNAALEKQIALEKELAALRSQNATQAATASPAAEKPAEPSPTTEKPAVASPAPELAKPQITGKPDKIEDSQQDADVLGRFKNVATSAKAELKRITGDALSPEQQRAIVDLMGNMVAQLLSGKDAAPAMG